MVDGEGGEKWLRHNVHYYYIYDINAFIIIILFS